MSERPRYPAFELYIFEDRDDNPCMRFSGRHETRAPVKLTDEEATAILEIVVASYQRAGVLV